jgi:hypothetical protein
MTSLCLSLRIACPYGFSLVRFPLSLPWIFTFPSIVTLDLTSLGRSLALMGMRVNMGAPFFFLRLAYKISGRSEEHLDYSAHQVRIAGVGI